MEARICPIHGTTMKLRRQGPNRPLGWLCPTCNAQSSRRHRARRRKRNIRSVTARLLRAQADQVLELMHAIVALSGGWGKLLDGLTPIKKVEFVFKLGMTHDQLREQ